MHHWQNFIWSQPHSEDAYLYEQREIRLKNIKASRRELGFHTHTRRCPFYLDCSFEHQFNSILRTLNETIGEWVLLMWGVGTLWRAIVTDKTTKLKIHIPMLLHNCNNNKIEPCVFFWNQRQLFWLVYTRLVTRLHLSALVYFRIHSSVTCLHLSTLIFTRLVTRLCFQTRWFDTNVITGFMISLFHAAPSPKLWRA